MLIPAGRPAEYSITSVARTVLRLFGAPDGGLAPGAAPADARVTAQAPAGGISKMLVYAPDAIGLEALQKFPGAFAALNTMQLTPVPVLSVFPPKTPVCFASMFSGLPPKGHGIRRYEKPVLACRTIFDALPQHGVRVAIAAVKDSSIDLIFRGRSVDYFSEADDAAVTRRALQLISDGNHDFLLVYHQGYDDTLHASDPWNAAAQQAMQNHAEAFGLLVEAFDKKWAGLPRAVLFAPDHGAHIDPQTGKGDHGDNIPGDMDVVHFWRLSGGAPGGR